MYVFKLPKQYSVPSVRCKQNPPMRLRIPSTFSGEKTPEVVRVPAESGIVLLVLLWHYDDLKKRIV